MCTAHIVRRTTYSVHRLARTFQRRPVKPSSPSSVYFGRLSGDVPPLPLATEAINRRHRVRSRGATVLTHGREPANHYSNLTVRRRRRDFTFVFGVTVNSRVRCKRYGTFGFRFFFFTPSLVLATTAGIYIYIHTQHARVYAYLNSVSGGP